MRKKSPKIIGNCLYNTLKITHIKCQKLIFLIKSTSTYLHPSPWNVVTKYSKIKNTIANWLVWDLYTEYIYGIFKGNMPSLNNIFNISEKSQVHYCKTLASIHNLLLSHKLRVGCSSSLLNLEFSITQGEQLEMFPCSRCSR